MDFAGVVGTASGRFNTRVDFDDSDPVRAPEWVEPVGLRV